jgi:hypothetical protein
MHAVSRRDFAALGGKAALGVLVPGPTTLANDDDRIPQFTFMASGHCRVTASDPDGHDEAVDLAAARVPPRPGESATGTDRAGALTHRYRLMAPVPRQFPGGTRRVASPIEFPISTTMTGAANWCGIACVC